MKSTFWNADVYRWVMAACLLFAVLTASAMLVYPGGTIANHATTGYSFLHNFFSDLGNTTTWSGLPNPISASLFFVALVAAGSGMALFFIAFARFFQAERTVMILSRLGSLAGVLSALCFIGVAFSPANLSLDLHVQFVNWAFRLFPVAVILYIIAILRQSFYPRRAVLVLGAFAILLILYLWLLSYGPGVKMADGEMIQATGQKIIVYASILTVLIQGYEAWRFANERSAQYARAANRESGEVQKGYKLSDEQLQWVVGGTDPQFAQAQFDQLQKS